MKTTNFNQIKNAQEVLHIEGVIVGKPIKFFLDGAPYQKDYFSENQIAFLLERSSLIFHIPKATKRRIV